MDMKTMVFYGAIVESFLILNMMFLALLIIRQKPPPENGLRSQNSLEVLKLMLFFIMILGAIGSLVLVWMLLSIR